MKNNYLYELNDSDLPLDFVRNGESFSRKKLLQGAFAAARGAVLVLVELGMSLDEARDAFGELIHPGPVDTWHELVILLAERLYSKHEQCATGPEGSHSDRGARRGS